MFAAKVPDAKYDMDPRKYPATPESQKGRDLRAFEIAVERFFAETRADMVACVNATGPIAPIDVQNFVETYYNGMEEVAKFLRINRSNLVKK